MPAIDVENAWGLDATSLGNHEFDYGVERLPEHIDAGRTSRSSPPTWSRRRPGRSRIGSTARSTVFTVNGIKVGVIGAELEETPELVSAGATAGSRSSTRGRGSRAESIRLKQLGVKVQIVVIHEGTAIGRNPIGQTRRACRGSARSCRSPTSSRTRRSTR